MTVDLVLYANLSLVLVPKHPNPLLADLIRESYPSLAEFHTRLDTLLESTNGYSNIPRLPVAPRKTVAQSVSSWLFGDSQPQDQPTDAAAGRAAAKKKKSKDPREKAFERGRWMWFIGAAGAMVAYLFMSGLIQIEFGSDDDDEADEDEDEEGEWIEVVEGEEQDEGEAGEEDDRSPLEGLVADDDDEE